MIISRLRGRTEKITIKKKVTIVTVVSLRLTPIDKKRASAKYAGVLLC